MCRESGGQEEIFYVNGNYFVKNDHGSPFVDKMPDKLVRPKIGGTRLVAPNLLKGVVQSIKTRKNGETKIPDGKFLGGSLQTRVVIDNATGSTVTAVLRLYANDLTVVERIETKSHHVFILNADQEPDILNLSIRMDNRKVDQSFMVRSPGTNEWLSGAYVYNVGKTNSYRVISRRYSWE